VVARQFPLPGDRGPSEVARQIRLPGDCAPSGRSPTGRQPDSRLCASMWIAPGMGDWRVQG